jgi:hypothetical protein
MIEKAEAEVKANKSELTVNLSLNLPRDGAS